MREETGETGMEIDFCMGWRQGCENVVSICEGSEVNGPRDAAGRLMTEPVRTLTPFAHLLEFDETVANSNADALPGDESGSSIGVRAPSGVSQKPGRRWDWVDAAACAAAAAAARNGWWFHGDGGRVSFVSKSQSGFTGGWR